MADEATTKGSEESSGSGGSGGSFFESFMKGGSEPAGGSTGIDFSAADKTFESMRQGSESSTDTGKGQESASPTDGGEKGAAPVKPATTEEGGKKPEKTPTGEEEGGEKKKGEGEEETLPFDKHPKWQAARAAEKRLNDLLTKHGYEDVNELEEAADTGKSLKELLGDKDAKQLLADSKKLADIERYWAEEEAKKLRETETQEQTIERLEKEKETLRQRYENKEADRQHMDESVQLITEYANTVNATLEGTGGMSDIEKDMLAITLGVDNPMDDVDISDKRAVKSMVNQGVTAFKEFVTLIKQQAVDEYVAGKSKIGPTAPKGGGAEESSVKTRQTLPKGASVDQVFDTLKSRLYENLEKGERGT